MSSKLETLIHHTMAVWHGDYRPSLPPLAKTLAEAINASTKNKLAEDDWSPASSYRYDNRL